MRHRGRLLDSLARAHVRVCEGQGAELLWRDAKKTDACDHRCSKIYRAQNRTRVEARPLQRRANGGRCRTSSSNRFANSHATLAVAFSNHQRPHGLIGDDSNKLSVGRRRDRRSTDTAYGQAPWQTSR